MTPKAGLNLPQNLGRLSGQWRIGPNLWRVLAIIGTALLLWSGYVLAGRPVTLIIDGQPYRARVHRLTVEAVLQQLGLALEAEDAVLPPPGTRLASGETITVELARPVMVEADGRTVHLLTRQQTAADVLAEAGVIVNSHDEILIDGVATSPEAALLPSFASAAQKTVNRLVAARSPRWAIASARPETTQLTVRRAIPVTLVDKKVSTTFYTTQPTVGDALLAQGISLFLEDKVMPGLETHIAPGMRVFIQRSIPVTVMVDGRTVETRTHQDTVEDVLAEERIALVGQDFSRTSGNQYQISSGDIIEVIRVREMLEIEEEIIPYESSWIPDPELELDQQEVRQAGASGVIKTRTRTHYENGQEVWRVVEDEWVDQEPSDRIIAYGTNIVVRTLETKAGPLEYWRKIPMLATAYSAATSGKEADHPRYGVTRSGLEVGFGMAAVDPNVVPLLTDLYVSDYGRALAADTGGLILGKRIDLAYEAGEAPANLYEWRDVYVLTPVPPPGEIRYVLPQWPQR